VEDVTKPRAVTPLYVTSRKESIMKMRTIGWMIPIAVCFVLGCSSEVRAAPRSPSAPLDGIYSISSLSGGGVWDLEWASTDAGARVFNRAPIPGAQNELFRLTWLFTDADRGDVYKIRAVHSNLCLTTWGSASGVKNLAQHQCVTDFHQYVDEWTFRRVCGGPCPCALNDCNQGSYVITSLDTGGFITLARGADINNWQPLQVGSSIAEFQWILTKQ
jgi:ricin-type beta-trefoil lectin protein